MSTMDKKEILSKVDHTLLNQAAKWEEIRLLTEDGIKFGTASVCIPPSYVLKAGEYILDRFDGDASKALKICTVIGFPNGYSTTRTKVIETEDAIKNRADEIDMVINIGWVKDGLYDKVRDEIKAVKEACSGKTLKVIIETCLLTEEEKKEMCRVVTEAGADYIKTSTGFSKGGATIEDVELFKKYIGENVKIKAAGGISSFADAEKLIKAGADRLGTSRLVRLMKEE